MPEHPDTLAKFCSTQAAGEILESRSLRWKAPHLMGDPFELTHQSELSFDPASLLDGVIRTATAMIFARDVPRSNSPLAMVVRRWRDEERFASPEEAEEVLRELMARMVDQRQSSIDEMMADWRRFTRQLRICAFSAKADNLPSWQRYGDNHRGVALRFQCGEHSTLPEPKPVQYQNTRPEITSLKEQLNAVLHNESVHAQERFLDKFLVKPPQASAEQEWRCFYHATAEQSSKHTDDSLWYDDRPFERSDLDAVYFGAFTPLDEKQRLLKLVREHYSEARIFQAQPVPGKYEIEFVRVRKG